MAAKQSVNDDWRSMMDKKNLGAWDLQGQEWTLEIADVVRGEVGHGKQKSKKPVVYFKQTKKAFPCNVTNAKAIAAMYGNKVSAWLGKLITIYPSTTEFGGNTVDCIRVRPGVPRGKTSEQMPDVPVDEEMRDKQNAARESAESEGRQPGED